MKDITGEENATYPSGLKDVYVPVTPNYILDYIWYRGDRIKPLKAELIGNLPDKKDSTLFGSDHKGIYAEFALS